MNVLIVIHLLITIALVICVLLQRTAQDGGGLMGGGGGGTMGGLFTARGSANLLTRTTAILATLFIAMSLLLGIVASRSHQSASLVEQIAPMTQEAPVEKAAEPAKDIVPVVPVQKK